MKKRPEVSKYRGSLKATYYLFNFFIIILFFLVVFFFDDFSSNLNFLSFTFLMGFMIISVALRYMLNLFDEISERLF